MNRFSYFCEGTADENVLAALGLISPPKAPPAKTGKDSINKKLIDELGPKLGVETVRALVMRD